MKELRNYENRRKQRFGKLRCVFEKIQTMRLMNYDMETMIQTLGEHPDYVYFVNNYIEAHKREDLETVIRKAYELLYSEEAPILKPKDGEHKSKTPEVPEINRKTMLEQCTERLIKTFLRDRIELVTELLSSGRFNAREFASLGYDREYMECLVRTVKLFSPTKEIKREMLQDRKRMWAIIDRVYEELYILSKREKCWTCDWLDFEGLKIYGLEEKDDGTN